MEGCIGNNSNRCTVTKEFLEESTFGDIHRCPICYTTDIKNSNNRYKGSYKKHLHYFRNLFAPLALFFLTGFFFYFIS